ncbi:MAG: DUF4268 domain-containing protein [Planctomycetota bacterium]
MTNRQPLGKLEKVDVHEYWANEAQDFTPWLAQEENIALLGEQIGQELEVQQIEEHIGLFRADIVCVDTSMRHKVLIENQLEKTDHSHLGQLLTYAAGLDAVTIIWIADRFTEEHRAALDWLNRITQETVKFFGCEIELWRIGDSSPAPKFNIVAKPNDWTKPPPPEPTSETAQLYQAYWSALRDRLSENKVASIRIGKPLPQAGMTFPVGRSGFALVAVVSKQKKYLSVYLVITGEARIPHFNLLMQQSTEIENQLGGETLEWRELREGKESHIKRTFEGIDPSDKGDWPQQHDLLIKTLTDFHRVLSPRVKDLDAAEWEPEE